MWLKCEVWQELVPSPIIFINSSHTTYVPSLNLKSRESWESCGEMMSVKSHELGRQWARIRWSLCKVQLVVATWQRRLGGDGYATTKLWNRWADGWRVNGELFCHGTILQSGCFAMAKHASRESRELQKSETATGLEFADHHYCMWQMWGAPVCCI